MFKNILIKISGEALQGEKGGDLKAGEILPSFNEEMIAKVVGEIIEVMDAGVKVSLVFGGGNFWRGRSASENYDRVKMDQIGMMATIMNAIYLAENFIRSGAKAVVMTPFVVGGFTELYSCEVAREYQKNGVIVIFAGGSGLPFFSTDTISVIRAAELNADAVLFAKPVSGLYDSDPNKNDKAVKYNEITCQEFVKQGLKAIDLSAVSMCLERGLKSVVFNVFTKGSIVTAATKSKEEIFKIGSIMS